MNLGLVSTVGDLKSVIQEVDEKTRYVKNWEVENELPEKFYERLLGNMEKVVREAMESDRDEYIWFYLDGQFKLYWNSGKHGFSNNDNAIVIDDEIECYLKYDLKRRLRDSVSKFVVQDTGFIIQKRLPAAVVKRQKRLSLAEAEKHDIEFIKIAKRKFQSQGF